MWEMAYKNSRLCWWTAIEAFSNMWGKKRSLIPVSICWFCFCTAFFPQDWYLSYPKNYTTKWPLCCNQPPKGMAKCLQHHTAAVRFYQGMFPALSTAWLSTVKCWKFRRSSNSSRNDGIGPSTELTARRYFKSPPCVICVIPCAAPPGLLLPSWFRSKQLLILPLAVFSHATTDTLADSSYYRQQTNETARQTCLQSSVVTGTLSGYHGKTRKWWTALCLPSKDIRSNKVTTEQLTAEQESSSESPALRTWQWWMSCQTSYKTNQVWN